MITETDILVEKLKKAVADEWFAFIQYINASAIASGFMRESISKDLRENAMEELEHLDKLVNRIQQLGSLPPVNPKSYYKITNCGIIVPKSVDSIQLAKDSLKSEECAIQTYTELATLSKELNDHTTYDVIMDILEDEEEHRFEMLQFIKDFEVCKKQMYSE